MSMQTIKEYRQLKQYVDEMLSKPIDTLSKVEISNLEDALQMELGLTRYYNKRRLAQLLQKEEKDVTETERLYIEEVKRLTPDIVYDYIDAKLAKMLEKYSLTAQDVLFIKSHKMTIDDYLDMSLDFQEKEEKEKKSKEDLSIIKTVMKRKHISPLIQDMKDLFSLKDYEEKKKKNLLVCEYFEKKEAYKKSVEERKKAEQVKEWRERADASAKAVLTKNHIRITGV